MRPEFRPVPAALLILLAACQRSAPPQEDAVSHPSPPAAQSALERAALKTGVIADASRMSPVGLYQRRHEAGRDLLCLVPDPDRQDRFRFGLEAIFGTEQHCAGHGSARRAGDKLILRFSGRSRCLIVAQYDGDRVSLPGVVDMKCDPLCSERGSLEGVIFPRLNASAGDAVAAKGRSGNRLCDG